jgi:UDP-N-acetylmuramate dehydrogenase
MTAAAFASAIHDAFGDRVQRGCPLAPLTTFRVGGSADWLLDVRTSAELTTALGVASREAIPVTMLGGGSNVLVSDAGIRGLVIRVRGGEIRRTEEHRVRADASVTINGLVRWTINHGCAGLEAWAGTPGTVGGAIFGNAHFAGRLIGDLVKRVRLVSRAGVETDVPSDDLSFGSEGSRLRATGEILVWAEFAIVNGDPATLRKVARESLAFRKRTQPLDTPSAGCIFRNPQPGRDAVPEGVPWSAGALIDRAGLKGETVGGARVSPTHGNFIVNEGYATARDIRELVERCRIRVRERFGVELREEIVYLGTFDEPRSANHQSLTNHPLPSADH